MLFVSGQRADASFDVRTLGTSTGVRALYA